MGVSTTHRINLSMWILIYSFSDTYYVWAACGLLLKLRILQDGRMQSRFLQGKLMPNLLSAGNQIWWSSLIFFLFRANLISAFLIIILLQIVTPDHKLLLLSSPSYNPICYKEIHPIITPLRI